MKFIKRLIHGKARIEQAKAYCAILADNTCNLGSFGHSHNQQGELIRERLNPRAIDRRHPLEKKYQN